MAAVYVLAVLCLAGTLIAYSLGVSVGRERERDEVAARRRLAQALNGTRRLP